MRITDAITITELARLLQKSRPTIYKYILDYEQGNRDALPPSVAELFRQIDEEDLSYDDILAYCKRRFGAPDEEITAECKHVIDIIRANQHRIDFPKLERFLRKVIR